MRNGWKKSLHGISREFGYNFCEIPKKYLESFRLEKGGECMRYTSGIPESACMMNGRGVCMECLVIPLEALLNF